MNMGQASRGLQEVNENVAESSNVSNEIVEVNVFSKELSRDSDHVKNNASDLTRLFEALAPGNCQ